MVRLLILILAVLSAYAYADVGITGKAATFSSSDGALRVTVIRNHGSHLALKGKLMSHEIIYEKLIDGRYQEQYSGPLPFHYFPYQGYVEDSGRFTYITERTALVESRTPRKITFKALPLIVSIEHDRTVTSHLTNELEELASGEFARTRFLPLTHLEISLSTPLVGPPSIRVLCESGSHAQIEISNPISVSRSCKT